jgi:hypothetical protein
LNFQLFGLLQEMGMLGQLGNSAITMSGPSKGIGRLGLPKPGFEQVGYSHGFEARVILMFGGFNRARAQLAELAPKLLDDPRFSREPVYAQLANDFLTSNAELTAILSEIHDDPRVAALNGKMISTGSGGTIFEESRLEEWYLWYANEFGPDAAKKNLDQWLDADEVDVVNTFWVYGLNLDDELPLEDGYSITPAARLPDSWHKELALQFTMPKPGTTIPFPTVVITRNCRVKKADPADVAPNADRNSDFWKAQRRLHDIAIVLNALPGVSCLPAFSTSVLSRKSAHKPS